MKKFLSALFSLLLVANIIVPVSASDLEENSVPYRVYSEDFPNAYIVLEGVSLLDDNNGSGSVMATFFVEETYSYDEENNQIVITDSRLLSKEEVDAIGEENFLDRNSAYKRSNFDSTTRYKLGILFSGSYNTTSKGVSYTVLANAVWDHDAVLGQDPMQNPAYNSDYIGLVWSGNFTVSSCRISAKDRFQDDVDIFLEEAIPNAGRVWSFEGRLDDERDLYNYTKAISLEATLSKNVLTGNGNTAEVVLQYIHTYTSDVTGSVSINASGPSFSLIGGQTKNWKVSCVLTGIPF